MIRPPYRHEPELESWEYIGSKTDGEPCHLPSSAGNRVTMELATVNDENPCGDRGLDAVCPPVAIDGTDGEKWGRRESNPQDKRPMPWPACGMCLRSTCAQPGGPPERTTNRERPPAARYSWRSRSNSRRRSRPRSAECDRTVAGAAPRCESGHRGNGEGVRYLATP